MNKKADPLTRYGTGNHESDMESAFPDLHVANQSGFGREKTMEYLRSANAFKPVDRQRFFVRRQGGEEQDLRAPGRRERYLALENKAFWRN